MKTKIFFLFLLISMFTLSSKAFSQDIYGSYSVGKTSCTIESSGSAFNVYWRDGIGSTQLTYTEELPNGNLVYEEYDGNTYSGRFIFKNEHYYSGIYERADGRKFNVKKRRE